MKILIANNRYFISGGPESYLFALMDTLARHGHDVIPFCLRYAQNQPSPYAPYFLPTPSRDRSAVYHEDLRLSLREQAALVGRSVYSFEARRHLRRLLSAESIDVAYLLAIANMISPSIVDELHRRGIPIVMRLSDYNITCASYLHLRDGRVCRDCLHNPLSAIRYRCVKDSAALSAVRVAAMAVHRALGIYDRVDGFVAPSKALLRGMVEAGLDESKFHYLPSLVDAAPFVPTSVTAGPIVYVGRLSPEKGVDVLLRAYAQLDSRPGLIIVGGGTRRVVQDLHELANQLRLTDCRFVGVASQRQIAHILSDAFCVVVPSTWLENSPITVYEAMAAAKPVVASRIGSLVEQVEDGVSGLTFEVGDANDLAERLNTLIGDPAAATAMGARARERVLIENAPDTHCRRLLDIFESVRSRRGAIQP